MSKQLDLFLSISIIIMWAFLLVESIIKLIKNRDKRHLSMVLLASFTLSVSVILFILE